MNNSHNSEASGKKLVKEPQDTKQLHKEEYINPQSASSQKEDSEYKGVTWEECQQKVELNAMINAMVKAHNNSLKFQNSLSMEEKLLKLINESDESLAESVYKIDAIGKLFELKYNTLYAAYLIFLDKEDELKSFYQAWWKIYKGDEAFNIGQKYINLVNILAKTSIKTKIEKSLSAKYLGAEFSGKNIKDLFEEKEVNSKKPILLELKSDFDTFNNKPLFILIKPFLRSKTKESVITCSITQVIFSDLEELSVFIDYMLKEPDSGLKIKKDAYKQDQYLKYLPKGKYKICAIYTL